VYLELLYSILKLGLQRAPNLKSMGTKYTAKEVVSVLPIVNFTNIHKHKFHEIIDVRTPWEYAEDHVQGSINIPVLSNEERAQVGTLYASDKLQGRKVGAALITRNISDHILNHFKDKDLDYSPLVYCWRGGQRSRSMATILKEIGFQPSLMQGGYKAYRKHVCTYLTYEESEKSAVLGQTNLDRQKWIRISGVTGSGKTLLLKALKERGEQILDLEDLAKHKGSILGDYPDAKQPSQKGFETLLYNEIEQLDASAVVWLENEGSKIGNIGVSRRVWEKMCVSPRVHIKVDLQDRAEYILQDYNYLIENAALDLPGLLKRLEKYAGGKKFAHWIKLLGDKQHKELVLSLMEYYDASYRVPSGTPLRECCMPAGLLLDWEKMVASDYITDFINIGQQHLQTTLETETTCDLNNGHSDAVNSSIDTVNKPVDSVKSSSDAVNKTVDAVNGLSELSINT